MNQLTKLLSSALAAVLVLCSGLNAQQTELGRGWQIRGGYIYVNRNSTEAWDTLPEMARRGMNTVFLAPQGVLRRKGRTIVIAGSVRQSRWDCSFFRLLCFTAEASPNTGP